LIQLDIFYKIQDQLKIDKNVSGIMLMGSVAQGNAVFVNRKVQQMGTEKSSSAKP